MNMDKRSELVEAVYNEVVAAHESMTFTGSLRRAIEAVAAHDAATLVDGLKWGCHLVKRDRGWCDIHSPDHSHWLGDRGWNKYRPDEDQMSGKAASRFHAESNALATLDACDTPPPGWTDARAEAKVCDCLQVKEQADAWEAVCAVLGEVDPKWGETVSGPRSGIERACDAIRRLAKLAGMATLNTSDASTAPIEQDGGKVCNVTREEFDTLRREVEAMKAKVSTGFHDVDEFYKDTNPAPATQPARYSVQPVGDDIHHVVMRSDGKYYQTVLGEDLGPWVVHTHNATWFAVERDALAVRDALEGQP